MAALLEKNGFTLVSSNGSHRKYRNAEGVTVILPYHAKELKKGTEDAILKQAGLK